MRTLNQPGIQKRGATIVLRAGGAVVRGRRVVRASSQRSHPPDGLGSDPVSTGASFGPILLGDDGGIARTSRRNLLGRAAVLGASLAACPCCEAMASGGAVFEYGQLSGPLNWGGVCKVGANQSPIDVPRKSVLATIRRPAAGSGACRPAAIDMRGYKPVKPDILNTGVGTMQVNYPKGSQTVLMGGSEFELLQFHFHTPSEHAFDGDRTAMEVHLVHRNKTTNNLAVLGALMESPGTPNAGLAAALKYAPTKPRDIVPCPVVIDPKQLLPRPGTPYIRYSGSLTTPSCNEGVEWYLLLDTVTVTPEQVLNFGLYVGGGRSLAQNSRPVQPINGRAFDLQYDCS